MPFEYPLILTGQVKFEEGPEEMEKKIVESWESFLDNNLNKEDIREIKDFFGKEIKYFKDLKIEKNSEIDNSGLDPKRNKIELKENEVNKDILKHELHHALVENKYDIVGIVDENVVFVTQSMKT